MSARLPLTLPRRTVVSGLLAGAAGLPSCAGVGRRRSEPPAGTVSPQPVTIPTRGAPGRIVNPILPGFNPDPSIERVGDDFFLVTSSFEWFPGIPIYHSRDLVHWRQLGHVLTRRSQLDLTRVSDSDGIFAPMLRWSRGRFYVLYTVVSQAPLWPLKGYPNYLVSAEDPSGPWSEPTLVDGLGFDPSLFVDDDGRAYIAFRMFDHRKGRKPSSPGIGLHEYDLAARRAVGEPRLIHPGAAHPGKTEGPHIYKRNGLYYLMQAEGGTSYRHCETLVRSRNVWGPYESAPEAVYPNKIFLTADGRPDLPLQKAGHASLVSSPDGRWYLAHLASRPLTPGGSCPLGRETCLQEVTWSEDGWLRLATGGTDPQVELSGPAVPPAPFPAPPARDDFDGRALPVVYQTLRTPQDDPNDRWLSFDRRPGWLSLRGRMALTNVHRQSLVARRITSFRASATTRMDFAPRDFRQAAGLVLYYGARSFFWLTVTHDPDRGRSLAIVTMDPKAGYDEPLPAPVPLPLPPGPVLLKAEIAGAEVQFHHAPDGGAFTPIGPVLDFARLSDENNGGFTGAMIGLAAQDLVYEDVWASFDWFEYQDV